jgi:hypothetical protein
VDEQTTALIKRHMGGRTGSTDDIGNPLAHPINITGIWCLRASGTCQLSTAEFSPEDSQLFSQPHSITASQLGGLLALRL